MDEAFEVRLHEAEKDIKHLYDRMGKVEDKASAAWKQIIDVNERMDKRMDNLEKEVVGIKQDVKEMKVSQNRLSKSIKALIWVVGALCVVTIGFLVYMWKHDAELVKNILTLGTAVGKLASSVPII